MLKTFTVHLVPLGKGIQAGEGSPLIDVLHEYGVEFPCGGKGTCGKCKVRLLEGELPLDDNHKLRLQELGLSPEWRLACLSRCHSDITIEVEQYQTLIQADESSFEFEPGVGLGIAVDLGTTTLVAQLLDLATGKILAVEKDLNPQKKYGSDLITRLETALRMGGDEMTRTIRLKIGEMIENLMEGMGTQVERVVIVGNTVMHHFFCGHDIKALSFYPFESVHMEMALFQASDLQWPEGLCSDIRFYPPLGSFVGSDILAGILATGMHLKKEYSVLIDLGTNGEIVVGNRDRIVCASTAAGPAFEGARISMGMLATTGAISSVESLKGGWRCRVIGNGLPAGICGSGLIDAVQVLLEDGRLGTFGEILSGDPEVMLEPPVKLTQKDIQEFQLAKAAIITGIKILLRRLSIQVEDVEAEYIAGGFGSYINLENVRRTGMLDCPLNIMHQLGNTALMGAKMFLFDNHRTEELILSLTEHLNLESEPDFQDLFVENLSFPGSAAG